MQTTCFDWLEASVFMIAPPNGMASRGSVSSK